MSLRPLISYTSSMCNLSRNILNVHKNKYFFIAQRPLASAVSSLFLCNQNQGRCIDGRHLLLQPSLISRTSIAEYHILQNYASRCLLQENDLTCSNLKYLPYPSLTLRALQLQNFSSTPKRNPQKENVDCSNPDDTEAMKKLTLVQRFKAMCKNYWHVLIPIHIITSVGWIGAFYYAATSGVDIPALLESLNLSETYIKPFRDSSMGYIAVAYGLYKIATPARYTVTLGGTSLAIRFFKKYDMVQPWPMDLRKLLLWLRRKK